MHARGAPRKSRREITVGPVRRAHPASGATWNVQVVRGKMTSRCLWHACKALIIGMLLMIIGAGMATIGRCSTSDSSFGHFLYIPICYQVTMQKIYPLDRRLEEIPLSELKTSPVVFI